MTQVDPRLGAILRKLLDGSVLGALKTEAERQGIPYQTFIGSLLHRYVHGELIDKKTIALAKQLRTT